MKDSVGKKQMIMTSLIMLKHKLEKFSKVTDKYIIMHDTTVDEWDGETVRQ